jgi:hypothetical protein
MTRLEEKPSKFAKANPCFQTRKALHFGHFFGLGQGNFSFNLKICLSETSTKIIIPLPVLRALCARVLGGLSTTNGEPPFL